MSWIVDKVKNLGNTIVDRLNEKSTKAALVGLVAVILPRFHVPIDLQPPLALFLVTFMVTKG